MGGGSDDSGLPQNRSGGYGSELTGGGNVELGDAGSRPTIEPAPTPPHPSYTQEAPAPGSRPTMDSFESRQSAPTQSTQQSAPSNNVSGSGGQKPLSQAAQNLFGVDASGRTRTPPPQTRQSAPSQSTQQSAPAQPARQSASSQPTRQSAPAPSSPSPHQGSGLPNNQNGKT